MSEQGTQQRSGQRGGQQASPLQSDRGNTVIQDGVVARVAGIAAQEVEGIRMGGGASQAVGGVLSGITGRSGSQTAGVSVEVGEVETAVDLTLTTEYGKPIPQLAEAVRRNVVNRIENLVGLRVTEVNINVGNIFFPQEEQQQLEEGQ